MKYGLKIDDADLLPGVYRAKGGKHEYKELLDDGVSLPSVESIKKYLTNKKRNIDPTIDGQDESSQNTQIMQQHDLEESIAKNATISGINEEINFVKNKLQEKDAVDIPEKNDEKCERG